MKTRPFYALSKPPTRAPDFRIVSKADTREATVYVYDIIDPYWGISAQRFAESINALDVDTLHLRINSPGGDVFEASAMIVAIRTHKANVVAHVDGIAASAASYLAMAANEVRIADTGFFMIHNPWSMAYGDAESFRKAANTLDKIADSIINEYTKRCDEPRETIETWMDDETWFDAEEAKEYGFADVIEGESAEPKNAFDLSFFSRVPDKLKERMLGFASKVLEEGDTVSESGRLQREWEVALRNIGFTRSQVRRAVTALTKPVLGQCDADENTDDDRAAVDQLLATIRSSHPALTHENRRTAD